MTEEITLDVSQNTSEQVSDTERANFESGLPAQDTQNAPSTVQTDAPATTVDSQETTPVQENTVPTQQETDDNPYAGMTDEEVEIRQAEEEVFYMQAQLKLKADRANLLKAEKARNEKLYGDYDALLALVTCADITLTEALKVNRMAILECLKDKRIMVGSPQPIKANGTIGLHHSDNGSRVVNGGDLPEKKAKKITPEISVQCRIEHEAGIATPLELANRYDVTVGYMHNILRGARGAKKD